jgi:hypothetical protein
MHGRRDAERATQRVSRTALASSVAAIFSAIAAALTLVLGLDLRYPLDDRLIATLGLGSGWSMLDAAVVLSFSSAPLKGGVHAVRLCRLC